MVPSLKEVPKAGTRAGEALADDVAHEPEGAGLLDEDEVEALELAVEDMEREDEARETLGDLDADDDAEPEEPISYRTRTMADLLAEQGDTQGALEIYQEILGRLPARTATR